MYGYIDSWREKQIDTNTERQRDDAIFRRDGTYHNQRARATPMTTPKGQHGQIDSQIE